MNIDLCIFCFCYSFCLHREPIFGVNHPINSIPITFYPRTFRNDIHLHSCRLVQVLETALVIIPIIIQVDHSCKYPSRRRWAINKWTTRIYLLYCSRTFSNFEKFASQFEFGNLISGKTSFCQIFSKKFFFNLVEKKNCRFLAPNSH